MMKETEKLRVLLSHWIEHNQEHADEFRRWAEKAGDAAPDVLAAAQRMGQVNQALAAALEKLGGEVAHDQHGGHDHK
jgi:rubrerythrin